MGKQSAATKTAVDEAAGTTTTTAPASAPAARTAPSAPQGYEDAVSDVVGFWDYEAERAIHFIPLEASVSDSKLDKNKPSVLIRGRLVDPCKLALKVDGKATVVEGQAGDPVGIWYKPGMKDLRKLAGVKVFMFEDGKKVIPGKPSPMVVFKVKYPAKTRGAELVIDTDTRRDSKGVKLSFPLSASLERANDRANGGGDKSDSDNDDVPF